MRAAIYLRQSLDRSGEGLAVARQREDCLQLCDQRGWDPVEYLDNDTSASSGKKRPAYERMLADIEADTVRAVVAWDLDRLHRRPIELEHFMDLADRKALALATVTGDVDLSTDNGRLFARIKGAVARAEVERKSARQKRQASQRASQGGSWGGLRAFGYAQPGNEIIENEAALLRGAYSAVLSGSSLYSIAARWNQLGITTTRGNKWSGSTVRQTLVNPRNAGLRAYHGEVVHKAQWEPLVGEDVWRSTVAILEAKSRRRGSNGRKNLLTGILICGRCDQPMGSGVSKEGDPIYVCKHCHRNSRRLKPVDDLVTKLVIAYFSQPDARDLLINKDRPDIGALQEEEKVWLEQLDKAALDHYVHKTLSQAQFNAVNGDLQQNLQAVRDKMTDVDKEIVFGELIESDEPEKVWKGFTLDRKRAVIRNLMGLKLRPAGRGQKFQRDHLIIDPLTAED